MATKQCSRCKQTKQETEFNKDHTRRDAISPWCRQCTHEYNQEYYKRNGERIRKKNRRWHRNNPERVRKNAQISKLGTYGLTVADYDRMYAEQNGVCAICGQPESGRWNGKERRLSVDHDHSTGEVRALLCSACNRGLGAFRDNSESLKSAAEYLEQHRG